MAASLLRQPRKTLRGFMLIPLVDVIFLLLTFFMLASSIDPFSMLTLEEYQTRTEGGRQPAAAAANATPDVVVVVERDKVQTNGTVVPLEAFAQEAARLRSQGKESVVVFTRQSATVQDIVSVLDALKKAPFRSVVIRSRATEAG